MTENGDLDSGEQQERGQDCFSAEDTSRTLVKACAQAGLDPLDAELLRLGENAVYRLRSVPVVARIARTAHYLPDARTEVAVAPWLESAGFPAVRPAGPADQPLVADGRVVSFWELAAEHQEYGTVAELAGLLPRLHALEAPPGLGLPELRPFRRVERRIEHADLTGYDRAFLQARLASLRDAYARLQFILPAGPVHGDASIGNIIRGRDGAAMRCAGAHHGRLAGAECLAEPGSGGGGT